MQRKVIKIVFLGIKWVKTHSNADIFKNGIMGTQFLEQHDEDAMIAELLEIGSV